MRQQTILYMNMAKRFICEVDGNEFMEIYRDVREFLEAEKGKRGIR